MTGNVKPKTPKDRRPRPKRSRAEPPPPPTAAALELTRRANKRARERNTAVRHGFIGWPAESAEPATDPPMALLLRASKGGAVRLKFYLALLWQGGGGDERHSVSWPARTWAALLDLPDPENRGDRRIRDAIRALERARLVTAKRAPGRPIELVLRRDDGTDRPYIHPGKVARATKQDGAFDPSELYVQIPPGFWTRGWAISLSAPGIAMLLVMLVLTNNAGERRVWIDPAQARRRFGLSEDSWARGVAELGLHGLLEIRKQPVGEDFGWRRVRNTYSLRVAGLDEDPGETFVSGVSDVDRAETGTAH
jgi:hypothetical protein